MFIIGVVLCVDAWVHVFVRLTKGFVSRAVVVGVCIVVNNSTGCHRNWAGISPISSPL